MSSDGSLQDLVCCLGQPVAGNPTQFMMERAFAAANLDWRYLTFEVPPELLEDAVRGLRAMGFRGGHITIPHKTAVVPLVDDLSEAAELIGAVNCVTRNADRLIGDNSDGRAFLASLDGVVDPQHKHVVVFGAGGTARAIAVQMALANAREITVVNRSAERGMALVELLTNRLGMNAHYEPWSGDWSIPEEVEIAVNATSVGLGDDEARLAVDVQSLRPGMVVADVIINPPHTRFLDDAAERGCTTLHGSAMLVHQGAEAFRAWTGEHPDLDVMREALEEYLEV